MWALLHCYSGMEAVDKGSIHVLLLEGPHVLAAHRDAQVAERSGLGVRGVLGAFSGGHGSLGERRRSCTGCGKS